MNPRRLGPLLALLAVLLAGPRPCLAGSPAGDTWESWNLGLPSFASVMALAVDPTEPLTVYAGSYSPPGMWVTNDGEITWQTDLSGDSPLEGQPILCLAWDASREYWLAGTAGGLFERPRDGQQWQAVPDVNGAVFDLALDDAGRVYAAGPEIGLWRRETDGDWTRLTGQQGILALAVTGDGCTTWLGTAGQGLWVSRDGGQGWETAPGLEEAYVTTLLSHPRLGVWAYEANAGQVWRSGEDGDGWHVCPALEGRVAAFAVDGRDVLYAAMEGQVARSVDAGRTWAISREGLSPQIPVLDLLVTEQEPDRQVVYAATRDGVYASQDGGQHWQRRTLDLGSAEVSSLARNADGDILAATPAGLYRRSPTDEAWQPVGQEFEDTYFYDLAAVPDSDNVYAGTQAGLVRSLDGGDTWQKVDSELSSLGMPGLLVETNDADHLFLRLAFERIYESLDGGRTWKARWEGMESHHVVLSMARSRLGEFWAGTQDGLFFWHPRQARWWRDGLVLGDQSVFALAFSPDGQVGYAGATNGLWRREQRHWTRCGGDVIRHSVTALEVQPGGLVLAGTRQGGVYRSNDGGDTWCRLGGIEPQSTVQDLLVDAENGMLYVATDRGVLRGRLADAYPASKDQPLQAVGGVNPAWQEVAQTRREPSPAVHTLRADEALLQQAAHAGFRAIVQVMSWAEIEPTRGQLHWEYPDSLVRAAGYYSLDLVVRLDHPPEWALEEESTGQDLPFELEAYLTFVERVARRYQGQVRAYVVWNEPNLYQEWGAAPDPEAYARLLEEVYPVIKKADPGALVVSAGLSPTNGDGREAMDDREFLERMYRAGAATFFDVLGAHPYGFAFSPDDEHDQHAGLNLNRIMDLRAIMEGHGDSDKAVWATEVGWTTYANGERAWLAQTPQQQADYLVRAWQKCREEFPWLFMFTVWNLTRRSPEEDEQAGYSIIAPDGSPGPAYLALKTAFSEAGSSPERMVYLAQVERLLPDPTPVNILASDAEIHLGDSE